MRNVTYFNPIHAEENTPLVTIFETNVEKKQSVALDSRGSRYVIELSKASFGGVYYPIVGTQWLLKKVSGIWTLMARSTQQNPQLDPAFNPVPGETYIGGEGKTIVVGDLQINGTLIGGGSGATTLDGLTDVTIASVANRNVLVYDGATSQWKNRKDILLEQATAAADAISSRVAGDTQERLIIDADGTLNWGPGNATQDTTLARTGSGYIVTNATVQSTKANTSDVAFTANATGDTFPRINVFASGTVQWGSGSGAQDTNLYRSAANTLKTDDTLVVALGATIGTGATIQAGGLTVTAGDVTVTAGNVNLTDGTKQVNIGGSGSTGSFVAKVAAATTDVLTTRVTTDTVNRYVVNGDGKLEWGDGSNAVDTNLYRQAAAVLQMDGALRANTTGSGNLAFASMVSGDSQNRWVSTAAGLMEWGSGSASRDTNLFRSAADTLRTDDSFIVGAAATIGTGATITAGGLTVTAGGATVAAGDITATTGNVKVTDGTKQVNVGASGSAASFAAKVAATTTDVLTSRVTTDAVDRFTVNGDGKLEWSDGTNAIDTNLYRQAASVLQIDGALRTSPAGSGSVAFASMATGDTQNRWVSTAAGLMEWGSGSAARDTNLYRSAADTLKTDDSFVVGAAATIGTGLTVTAGGATVTAGNATVTAGNVNLTDGTKQVNIGASGSAASFAAKVAATTTDVLTTRVTTDTVDRHVINGDGKLEWSDGTNAIDTNLYRSAADTLATDDSILLTDKTKQVIFGSSGGSTANLAIERANTGDFLLTSFITGDTQRRYRMTADGQIQWGPGGSTAVDTNLYRSAADTLKTDDSLVVGAAATIGTGLTVTAGGATITAGNLVVTAGDVTMSTSTANLTMGGKIHGRGVIGANTATASVGTWPVQSTGAEVAIAAANWNTEPTYAFLDGRLYIVRIRYALISNAVDDRVVMRVRKGSATTAGTQLGIFGQGHNATSTNSGFTWFYIKNVSGSTVSTKLSLTISGVAAGSSFNPSADQPMVMAVEDIGATSDQTDLATIAFAIT